MSNVMRAFIIPLASALLIAGVALAAAKRAAGKADFDQAISSAKEAEALAKASIFQAASEKEAWKQLEIR